MSDRILIVDDDQRLVRMLQDYLQSAGYLVESRATGKSGFEAAERGRFDLAILDVMLPDLDGLELCRRIRAASDLPIVMLTARGDDSDRIVGLELGADDYLPKPFNPRELLARIKAVLRRRRLATVGAPAPLRFGNLEIDRAARQIRLDGEERELTSHQFDLLVALAENAGRVLSRDRLMDIVKGESLEAFDRSIDVHISRIRAAIEDDPKHPRRIVTVRGAGYIFARSATDHG
jgi:DNA-binding response OmpR family regulator